MVGPSTALQQVGAALGQRGVSSTSRQTAQHAAYAQQSVWQTAQCSTSASRWAAAVVHQMALPLAVHVLCVVVHL
jgi:hypothetical protein